MSLHVEFRDGAATLRIANLSCNDEVQKQWSKKETKLVCFLKITENIQDLREDLGEQRFSCNPDDIFHEKMYTIL